MRWAVLVFVFGLAGCETWRSLSGEGTVRVNCHTVRIIRAALKVSELELRNYVEADSTIQNAEMRAAKLNTFKEIESYLVKLEAEACQ